MKEYFRQSMDWLHTWTGLVVSWVLLFIFVTGTAGYFDTEIDRWMQPEAQAVTAQQPTEQIVAAALARLRQQAPAADRWFIYLPTDRSEPHLRIRWQAALAADGTRASGGNEQLDNASGLPLAARATGGGQFLYKMHYRLHYLSKDVAYWAVGVATMFMLVALVTGIIVHKKIFADFFTFRPGKGQRTWLDAHNVLSVLSLPFQLMITYSGLIFFAITLMPLIVTAYYEPGEQGRQTFRSEFERSVEVKRSGIAAPLTPIAPLLGLAQARWGADVQQYRIEIRHPDDANARIILRHAIDSPSHYSEGLIFDGVSGALLTIQPPAPSSAKAVRNIFIGLHVGRFADPLLRWLYFASGLFGAGMIATGLVLWAAKRRQRAEKQNGAAHFGLRLVERLNIGTIVGLPIAIAAYFWANRLLPLDLPQRGAWEVHVMFIVWAIMLLHATLRPHSRAWIEQFGFAAAAFAMLPVLNAITTDRHLAHSLATDDWVFAGFDLTMLGLGLVFLWSARKLARRANTAVLATRPKPDSAVTDLTTLAGERANQANPL
ncbi:MAG: PepSY-associated TM helix domain-containing protein [Thiobacillus sp.]|nr:PepSY-associated TM helix domain-containing protein [Thiobacillus sp.]